MCLDFLSETVQKEPSKRATAQQALDHGWLSGKAFRDLSVMPRGCTDHGALPFADPKVARSQSAWGVASWLRMLTPQTTSGLRGGTSFLPSPQESGILPSPSPSMVSPSSRISGAIENLRSVAPPQSPHQEVGASPKPRPWRLSSKLRVAPQGDL